MWSTNYSPGDVLYSDLDGTNIDTTNFQFYVYSYHVSNNLLYVVGPRQFWTYDTVINMVESMNRSSFYLNLVFQGADTTNIYFYDLRDGGFVFAPINPADGTYVYSQENEIAYSGWQKEFRVTDTCQFLLSEWPPDSF